MSSVITGNVGVVGATVYARSNKTNVGSSSVVTAIAIAAGDFTLPGLPAGTYIISASADGQVYRQSVSLTLDGTNNVSGITLSPALVNSSNQ